MRSYSPLRYPGGKIKLYKFMLNILYENNAKNLIYMEPYAGGFGLGMKLLLANEIKKVHINDADICIYSFWDSIVNNSEKFIKKIIDTPIDIYNWNKQKKIYDFKLGDKLDLGFATFYLNRCNRSGILKAGPIGGKKQDGNYKLDCRYNKENLINLILQISSYKEQIIVTNLDGNDLLNEIASDEKYFIYIDPPYVEKGQELYRNFLTISDHEKLSKTILSLKSKWFLTYDNSNLIKKLYHSVNIFEFEIRYSINKEKQSSELGIYNENIQLKESMNKIKLIKN